jgi:hypothetical protein
MQTPLKAMTKGELAEMLGISVYVLRTNVKLMPDHIQKAYGKSRKMVLPPLVKYISEYLA